MELNRLIELLRTKKGFSQRQLAMYAGVSNTEISFLESGKRKNPSPEILKKISPYLDITYEELMEAAGYMSSDKPQTIPSEYYDLLKIALNFEKEELICMLKIKGMGISIFELCNFAINLSNKK